MIRSRPTSREYRDNYDRLFRAAKDARKKRGEERQEKPAKPQPDLGASFG